MSFEDFERDLHAVRDELRVQNEELVGPHDQLDRRLDRYRALFELSPVACLVTDRFGVIQEVNRRAANLLGDVPRFLVGRPLSVFVAHDDRAGFRDHLARLRINGSHDFELRLQPPRRPAQAVPVTVDVFGGNPSELRWLLREPDPGGATPAAQAAGEATVRAAGSSGGSPAPDWDDLAEALHEIIAAAIPLLRADGVGLMLADREGALRWVTATNQAEQAFEQAERDLGEGPCIDAFTSCGVVATANLRADPRWPRLGPAARAHQIRGVLSSPVLLDDQPIGTCNALTTVAREWTEADAGAVRAFAVMLGRLIGSITDARHKTELTAQLQVALTTRILVEQAKGVLMEREGIGPQRAFELLRRRARSSERKLADVALEVVSRHA